MGSFQKKGGHSTHIYSPTKIDCSFAHVLLGLYVDSCVSFDGHANGMDNLEVVNQVSLLNYPQIPFYIVAYSMLHSSWPDLKSEGRRRVPRVSYSLILSVGSCFDATFPCRKHS